MEELALAVGGHRGGPRLGDEAVHVPLDVVDRGAREDRDRARPRCGRRPRAARSRGRAAGGSPSAARPGTPIAQSGWARNRSLSALTISGSIHRPNCEAQGVDVARERRRGRPGACAGRRPSRPATSRRCRAARTSRRRARTARRRGPSPCAAIATIRSWSKSKYVASQLLSTTGRGRSRHGAARQPLAVQAVERVAEAAQAIARPGDHGLRRGERRAGLEAPRERLGVDADPQPRRPERLDLRLGEEVARVRRG